MYCVAVTYVVQAGHEDTAIEFFKKLTVDTRTEPGNVMYVAHRSTTEPRQFFLYEQYVDEAAFQSHRLTPHFIEYATNGLFKLIESRVPAFYQTLED